MKLTIYGTGTSGTQMVRSKIEEFLTRARIPFEIEEVHDVSEIMARNISSVPAVRIDDDEIIEIRKGGQYNSSLRSLIQKLLRNFNYGTLPKIVAPTDFSATASNACMYAHKLAEKLDAVLMLTHVYYQVSPDINGHVVIDLKKRKERKELLKNTMDTLNRDWIGDVLQTSLVDMIFEDGFPVSTIIQIAKREKANWIIMGTTGEGATIKSIFGSVSTDIMEKGHTPMILIPPHAKFNPFSTIVFATSSPNHDIASLLFLTKFAHQFQCQLHILHVSEKSEEWVLKQELIHAVTNHYPKSKLTFVSIFDKNIPEAIESYAIKQNADLVAVTKRKKSILQSLFGSKVKRSLAFSNKLPLMVIPEGLQ